MNEAILIGRLTKDPDVQKTGNQSLTVARFTVATNRPGKDAGADYINCRALGKTGDVVSRYLKKGDEAAFIGRITTDSWEQDDQKRYATYVLVRSIHFTHGAKRKEEAPAGFEAVKDWAVERYHLEACNE